VLALVIWLPYIRFESTRGFADIRSQLLVQGIAQAPYSGALCDSTLTLRQWEAASVQTASGSTAPTTVMTKFVIWSGGHLLAAARGLVGNFGGLVPGVNLALLVLTVAGLMIVGLRPGRGRFGARDLAARFLFSASWPTALAIGLLAWALVANEEVLGRVLGPRLRLGGFATTSIRILQGLAAFAGIALLTRRSIARFLEALATRLDPASRAPRVLVVALVVPWIVLLLVVEPGRQDRLLGLWPLQAIVLSFVAVTLSAGFGRAARLTHWLAPLLIAMLMVINPLVVSKVEAWRHDGWSGSDAVEIQIADYLARRLHDEGRTRAVIGYRLFTDEPLIAPWKIANARWKVGEEFDVALEYHRGISNLNRCVEGLSTHDEYRIVEVPPPSTRAGYYFDVPLPGHLRLLDRIGNYDVYQRE
jgi:hypothetical protein